MSFLEWKDTLIKPSLFGLIPEVYIIEPLNHSRQGMAKLWIYGQLELLLMKCSLANFLLLQIWQDKWPIKFATNKSILMLWIYQMRQNVFWEVCYRKMLEAGLSHSKLWHLHLSWRMRRMSWWRELGTTWSMCLDLP